MHSGLYNDVYACVLCACVCVRVVCVCCVCMRVVCVHVRGCVCACACFLAPHDNQRHIRLRRIPTCNHAHASPELVSGSSGFVRHIFLSLINPYEVLCMDL